MRFKISKIGLLNFWLYDEEEFTFSDGKLLLRGSNGSGKSVTMQSFIPLILDGNKTPARLDPFGSKDKKIEDYLLGGEGNAQKDDATGYLYMEVYHEEKQKYVTIGMGLHARRGRPTDFWGFGIEDGRRIGIDLLLYNNKTDKVLLTKHELRSRLGSDNTLVETTKDYKKMVNRLLFGFQNLDSYDEFINVLLQLRSPKLSKEYKPTKLMEILSSVLQPLTEEDLRPLSEAIEEMDKTKEKIRKMEDDVKQLSYLTTSYNNYNETILYRKASTYLERLKENENHQKQLSEVESIIQKEEINLKENAIKIRELVTEKTSIETKKANINSDDLKSKTAKLQILENEIKNHENKKVDSQTKLKSRLERQIDLQNEQKSIQDEKFKIESEFQDTYEEVSEYSESIKFNEIILVLKDLLKDLNIKIDFTHLKNRLFNYQSKIKQIKEKLLLQKQIEEKRNEYQIQHDKLEKEYEKLKEQSELQESKILDELREIKDKILLLFKNNQIIKMNKEEYDDIILSLKDYDKNSYSVAKQKYDRLAEKIKTSITDEFYRIKEKRNRKEEEIRKLELELAELKSKKEEEIALDEEEQDTLKFLQESNIPYIPFYKAVEFKENISEKEKNRIESILLASGVLSAQIVSLKNRSKLEGHRGVYLFPSKKKQNNLTKYLVVSPSVSKTDISPIEVTEVLESISIDKNDIAHVTIDNFQMDYITGYPSHQKEAKYIGAFLREQEHLRKIKEQEKLLESENAILNNLEFLLNGKTVELSTLEHEKDSFPKDENLTNLALELEKLQYQLERINEEQMDIEKKIREISSELEELFRSLNELKKDITLPLYLETFEEALQNIDYLKTSLSELEKVQIKYQKNSEILNFKNEQLQDIEDSITEIQNTLEDIQIELKAKKQERQDLENILNSDKYKDLSKALIEMEERQTEIESLLKELHTNNGKSETLLENKKQEKTSLMQKSERQNAILAHSEKFFLKELELGYVLDEKMTSPSMSAKKVIDKLHSRRDADIENIKKNYYAAYNEYRLKLNDYHLTDISLFETEIYEDVDDEIRRLIQENRRSDITAMYQGRTLNIYNLTNALQEAIVENNQIINDQDRHLFEEILLKTIGTKIRDRIFESKEWVKKMNDIMKTMQKDSPLSFQLEWKSKDAEAMEELETKELVRIFQIPSDALKTSDSEKLIKHFRSKLKRELDLSSENYATYANVIFKVLDYRTWFEFKLNYQRTGENKRELTDKVFAVFSGGEKAKTMYIPLFAAIYAKLLSARGDALRIIALDEAFAGVDDINIREMFGIMSSLDLDYILTSQALWGDYDTVSDLAISELLRPNNSTAVGVRRYHWNGKTKEVILNNGVNDDLGIF